MLAEQGIQLESIGGDVVGVPISALKVKEFISHDSSLFDLF